MSIHALFESNSPRVARRAGRLRYIAAVAAGAVAVGVMSASPREVRGADDEGCNVILIIADDLGPQLGSYGHPDAITPEIDRLADEGVRFDRAYSQVPICRPSRISFLTGLRPARTGVLDNKSGPRELDPSIVTLPEYFRKNGYFTASIGKVFHTNLRQGSHTGNDHPPSWDLMMYPVGVDVARAHETTTGSSTAHRYALSWADIDAPEEEWTDFLQVNALEDVLSPVPRRPFFIAVGFNQPHDPFMAPTRYRSLYAEKELTLPELAPGDRDDIPRASLWIDPPNFGLDEESLQELGRAYLASVSYVDAQVGRTMKVLDELGLLESTVVVFMGDHGYQTGEHGLWRKSSLFENSIRTPLIVRAPGVGGNGTSSPRVVELVDLFPTLVEVCRLPPSEGLDGRSLATLLHEPYAEWDHAAFSEVISDAEGHAHGRSVRMDRYHYIEWDNGESGVELYDLASDPGELTNLAGKAGSAEVTRRMTDLIRQNAWGSEPSSTAGFWSQRRVLGAAAIVIAFLVGHRVGLARARRRAEMGRRESDSAAG